MSQTQTHDLTFTDGEVRKRYVTWDRGEAEREWACLTLLAEHAPGVAPRPATAVGLTDEQRDRMSAYRPLWTTFWLAMLLPGSGGFRRNPPGTVENQARHLFSWLERGQPLT